MNVKTIKGNLMGIHRCDEADIIEFDSFWVELYTDPSDGFRSYLNPIIHQGGEPLPDGVIKFYHPIAPATLYYVDDLGERLAEDTYDMVRVIGDDGYVWATAGTNYIDDYYPCAYVNWIPREPE